MTKQQIWEAYTKSWKAASVAEKRDLYAKALSPEARYTDPLATTTGWDELQAYMVEFHKQVPGGSFETTYFSEHHDRSIARWNMKDARGTVIGDGISYAEYNADGKLATMTGFFETPAQ